ncbi:unnamed protein product, partial [Mesorhabditis spiculigera]
MARQPPRVCPLRRVPDIPSPSSAIAILADWEPCVANAVYGVPSSLAVPQYVAVESHLTKNPPVQNYPFTAPAYVVAKLREGVDTRLPPGYATGQAVEQPLQDWNTPNNEWNSGGGDQDNSWNNGHMSNNGLASTFQKSTPLQVVFPPSPNEKDWVMTAGNESQVDNVLAISLNYGGRLVSMGYYLVSGTVHYYAIMHKYTGPVFIKPGPMTFDELIKAARENELRDLALTQVCGQEEEKGVTTFSTSGSLALNTLKNKNATSKKRGYRLTHLCGYSAEGRGRYVGVWQKPTLNKLQYEAHYGVSLENIIQKDRDLLARHYVASSIRCFNNRQQVLCTGIWEYRPGQKSTVLVGENLPKMYTQFKQDARMLPRQISHITDPFGNVKFVVLWSDVHSNRYPNPAPLWNETNHIPVRFLKGAPDLLTSKQLDFIVRRVEHFMKDLNIPGLSIAISKKEQLKFAAGFGYADIRAREPVTPNHQFRVGSVSKPVTAAAIMLLVDQGRLELDHPVWGRSGYLGMDFAEKKSYRRWVTDVTVRNLLEHTSGGWDNLASDAAWIQPELSTKDLIKHVLENVLLSERPGKNWIYSNFGYQVLGYLIEKVSGQTYENFVKKNIFAPADVHEIQVARPSISDRAPREVMYYMSGTGIGFNPYEMLPPERIGPWGGWIASPIQLLMFMAAVDGSDGREDILSEDSVNEWVKASPASNDTYGLGWSVNIMGFNGLQHDGRMPGSASMLVRLTNGLAMAVTVNKEYSERDFFHELGYVLHHIGNNCDWWNETTNDLFQKRIK